MTLLLQILQWDYYYTWLVVNPRPIMQHKYSLAVKTQSYKETKTQGQLKAPGGHREQASEIHLIPHSIACD